MILYLNCSDKNNKEKDKAMDYKLTWGMISNYLEGTSSSRAAFTIHNNSNKILGFLPMFDLTYLRIGLDIYVIYLDFAYSTQIR